MAALLLADLLLLAVGVPLPLPRQGKDRSQPFMCMDSVCGCQDAAACWDHCCCHTNAEKLAWAKEQGITPPEFVVAAAKLEVKFTLAERKTAPAKDDCCPADEPATHACSHDHGTETCQATAHDHAAESLPAKKQRRPDSDSEWGLVLLASAQHCQGGARFLWLGDWTALPVAEPVVTYSPVPSSWIELRDVSAPDTPLSPPVPPPKLAA